MGNMQKRAPFFDNKYHHWGGVERNYFNKFIHEHCGGNEVFSLYIILNINQFTLCIEHKFANREKLDTEYSIHLSV